MCGMELCSRGTDVERDVETDKSAAWDVQLSTDTTWVRSNISEGQGAPRPSLPHRSPNSPETFRCNMDGDCHGFAPERCGRTEGRAVFSFLYLLLGACLSDHCVNRPRASKSVNWHICQRRFENGAARIALLGLP